MKYIVVRFRMDTGVFVGSNTVPELPTHIAIRVTRTVSIDRHAISQSHTDTPLVLVMLPVGVSSGWRCPPH